MTPEEILNNILLNKFVEIRGFSSKMFSDEEWREFEYFVEGYNLAIEESNKLIERNDV